MLRSKEIPKALPPVRKFPLTRPHCGRVGGAVEQRMRVQQPVLGIAGYQWMARGADKSRISSTGVKARTRNLTNGVSRVYPQLLGGSGRFVQRCLTPSIWHSSRLLLIRITDESTRLNAQKTESSFWPPSCPRWCIGRGWGSNFPPGIAGFFAFLSCWRVEECTLLDSPVCIIKCPWWVVSASAISAFPLYRWRDAPTPTTPPGHLTLAMQTSVWVSLKNPNMKIWRRDCFLRTILTLKPKLSCLS